MNYKRLLISLALPQLAGLIGSIFTVTAIPVWYAQLAKPAFSPPNWLFGPVWVILYLMMGISIYLVWQRLEKNKHANTTFNLFWLQLILNGVWSPLFFGLKNPGLAFFDLLVLWILVMILAVNFFRICRPAAYLLIPYWLWVSFAGALNYFIWILN